MTPPAPLRLMLDGDALVANWRWLARAGAGAACGAAVKADGYGLGARAVVERLARAGCRDFFVATWAEAAALAPWTGGLALSVLHGFHDDETAIALSGPGRPVLNSAAQIARWRAAGGGACDVMVDTGMSRLGIDLAETGPDLLDGLAIETLMSHLACADEPDHPLNELQRARFDEVRRVVAAKRYSLANSAGICLGSAYALDLTRPGLALYGGIPATGANGHIRQVARIEARIVQKRMASPGATVGYGATFALDRPTGLIVLNVGYGDGYLRGFSHSGAALIEGLRCPVVGRVSMDLTTIDAGDAFDAVEPGDWIEIEYDLPTAAAQSGLSQYELLTGLGARYQRHWI